jgi:hypothetical protein
MCWEIVGNIILIECLDVLRICCDTCFSCLSRWVTHCVMSAIALFLVTRHVFLRICLTSAGNVLLRGTSFVSRHCYPFKTEFRGVDFVVYYWLCSLSLLCLSDTFGRLEIHMSPTTFRISSQISATTYNLDKYVMINHNVF